MCGSEWSSVAGLWSAILVAKRQGLPQTSSWFSSQRQPQPTPLLPLPRRLCTLTLLRSLTLKLLNVLPLPSLDKMLWMRHGLSCLSQRPKPPHPVSYLTLPDSTAVAAPPTSSTPLPPPTIAVPVMLPTPSGSQSRTHLIITVTTISLLPLPCPGLSSPNTTWSVAFLKHAAPLSDPLPNLCQKKAKVQGPGAKSST
jgi:hypothetical protein